MNIEGLLNINLTELRNFSLQANLVDNEQNKRVVEKSKTALRRIEETHLQSCSRLKVSQQTIDELIRKVNKLAQTGKEEFLSARELRILSYNLNKVSDRNALYVYCLNVIENNWRDIYFNGLVYFLMSNWCEIDKEALDMASTLLIRKLKDYTGANKRYLVFKDHCNFFEENGPTRMCAIIRARGYNLEDAPSVLCLNSSSFNLSYYDDVIIDYFSRDNLDNLGYIEDVLEKHNSTKTKKLVFANLIIDANRNGADVRQVQIGNMARRLLGGDISLPTTWSPFFGATPVEVAKLKRAYEIVTIWYAKQVIQTFFDVCVQDPERKSFWLQYVKEILDFRIVGSSSIKSSLNSDSRVRQQLPKIFVETNSVKSKTAALIMYIRDRVFVEFSDTGSVYIYPPSHTAIKSIRSRRYIDSINDLKDTSIGKAIEQNYYYNTYNDYGMLRHAGAWQERLYNWMLHNILNRENTHITTIDDAFIVPSKPEKRVTEIDDEEKVIRPTSIHTNSSRTTDTYTQNCPQLNLFDEEVKMHAVTPQVNRSDIKSSSSPNEKYLKSKHIFDGQYQICISTKGLSILDVATSHVKILYPHKFDMSIKGQIWIKKQRTDGYLPIIYNVNDTPKHMGFIKMAGKEICYRDPNSCVKRFKITEI